MKRKLLDERESIREKETYYIKMESLDERDIIR